MKFFSDRKLLKDRLSVLKAELKLHRQTLAAFERMKGNISPKTSDEVLQVFDEAIIERTAQAENLEREIREINRILKTKYSLLPAA